MVGIDHGIEMRFLLHSCVMTVRTEHQYLTIRPMPGANLDDSRAGNHPDPAWAPTPSLRLDISVLVVPRAPVLDGPLQITPTTLDVDLTRQ